MLKILVTFVFLLLLVNTNGQSSNGGDNNSGNNQNNQITQGNNNGTNNQTNTINQGTNNGTNNQINNITQGANNGMNNQNNQNNQGTPNNNNQNQNQNNNQNQNQNSNQNQNQNQNSNQNQNGNNNNIITTQPGTFGNGGNNYGGYGPWNYNLGPMNGIMGYSYDYNNEKYQDYENNQNGYGNGFDYMQNTGIRQTLDESDRYSRPCPVYDTNCIRKFFAAHSKCKITYDPIPDPLFRAFNNLYFPALNITVTQNGVIFTGLRTNIEEFFVDKETKEVVLQVRFRNVNFNTTADFYRFQRDGKEPAITKSNAIASFPNFSVTTVFRNYEHLDLANSESVGYVDALPSRFILNPSAGVHPDPTVPVMFANFVANPITIVQEVILTVAAFFNGYFIQYNICDFGLKLF